MISITKIFNFEAAHSLSAYEGACKNIHGHSYQLFVTVTGKANGNCGMLIDFKELKTLVQKKIIQELDHALILKSNRSNEGYLSFPTKLVWVEEEPSVEFLIQYIADKICLELPPYITLIKIKLFETQSCYAEWEPDYNQ